MSLEYLFEPSTRVFRNIESILMWNRIKKTPLLGKPFRYISALFRLSHSRQVLSNVSDTVHTLQDEVAQLKRLSIQVGDHSALLQLHNERLDTDDKTLLAISDSAVLSHQRLDKAEVRIDELSTDLDGSLKVQSSYDAAIRGLELALRRHEAAFARIKEGLSGEIDKSRKHTEEKLADEVARLEKTAEAVEQQIEHINAEKIHWIEVDCENIRSRIEFIRKETLYEVRKILGVVRPGTQVTEKSADPYFTSPSASSAKGNLRLNIGCGHKPLDGYINVDQRELPGVDLVADITRLPYDPDQVSEIYSSHVAEHFSIDALERTILPYWHNLLAEGGRITIIAPNTEAMIDRYSEGVVSFAELSRVILGDQEYEGDFHFSMLTPEIAKDLLKKSGFSHVEIVEAARASGDALEFEIRAVKGSERVAEGAR